MSDRVAVLREGVLQQVDEPTHLYEHPGNTFVAGFIGSPAMTLIDGAVVDSDGRARLGVRHGLDLGIPREYAAKTDDRVIVGVRPESWEIVGVGRAPADGGARGSAAAGAPTSGGGPDTIPLKVRLVERLGGEAFLHCRTLDSDAVRASVRGGQVVMRLVTGFQELENDMVVHVRPAPGSCTFFHPDDEINLEYL